MPIALQRLSLRFGVVALTFSLVILGLRLVDGSGSGSGSSIAPHISAALPHDATTGQQIEALRADIRADPSDIDLRTQLGLAYLTRVGETANPSFYLDSKRTLDSALRKDPTDFAATSATGKLALSRHDFRAAFRYGERARRVNPTIAGNYGVLTDANVELGRYAAAKRTLQRWVNLRPGLASYARVSYFRELHGDLVGALAAMRLAVEASGSKDFPYVQSLVGKLQFDLGRYGSARRVYQSVLAVDSEYPAALAGLGAVDAAQGSTAAALHRYRAAGRALPTADHPLAIGEIQQAAGHDALAKRAYARAEALIRRELPYGVDVRAELALFEAEHGNRVEALKLARAALPVRPSVTTADALAWALHRAGRPAAALAASQRAMRLGSRDPGFLYRAGKIALAAGREARAERLLRTLLSQSPRFSPLYAPRARAALARLR
jgi:tetratricopeptide (TPR) repeat protein